MITGTYAITSDRYRDTADLLSRTERLLEGGIAILQYRNKHADSATRSTQATALVELCSNFQVPLIINDDVKLAAACGAQGVHLGKDDASLAMARATLGEQAIIGVSCYASMRRAVQAQEHGASYVAFGAMFASSTKPLAPLAPLDLLTSAKQLLDVNVVAIGGITLDNASSVIQSGADAVAVISALYDAPDCKAAASAFAALFKPQHPNGDHDVE